MYEETVAPVNSGSLGNYIIYQVWGGTGLPIIENEGNDGFWIYLKSYIIVSGFVIRNVNTGLYITGGTEVIVRDNPILDCVAMGIFLDVNNDTNFKIHNNTISGCDFAGIFLEADGSSGVELVNNMISDSSYGIGFDGGDDLVMVDYNLLWGNDEDYLEGTPGPHDISADPLFVDAENGDFRLRAGSPAINAGATLTEVTTDILGVSRAQGDGYDIGAFEYYAIPVSLTALSPDPTTDSTPTLTGSTVTIAEADISAIEFSLNGGEWSTTGVTGTDSFSITLPELTDDSHTIRVRAVDSFSNTTDAQLYGTDTFIIDTTPPELPPLPGYTGGVNLEEGATITDPLYILTVKPTDTTAVDRVEFYVDDALLCTVREADENGIYSCEWDTTLYHSDILVRVYDTVGNMSEIVRTVTVKQVEEEEPTEELAQTGIPILWIIILAISLPTVMRARNKKCVHEIQ